MKTMRLSWKLLPVGALFALGVALVTLPVPIVSAHTITVPTTIALNTPTAITVNIDAGASQSVTLSAAGSVANAGLFVGTPTVSTGETVGGSGTASVSFTENATSVARTLTAQFQCTQAATVTFFLFVNGVQQVLSGTVTTTCGTGTTTGTGTLTATPQLLPIGGQGTITALNFNTTAGAPITLTATPAIAIFPAQPTMTPAGEIFTGLNTSTISAVSAQSTTRTLSTVFTCTSVGTVYFTLSTGTTYLQSQLSVFCGTGTALTPTVGAASNVTVAASPTSVSCNGTAFVTVTVRNAAGGYVADGSSVTLTASLGSLSPTTATTLGGGVLAVYTAPGNQSGTANITASAAGAATGQATIAVNCTTATPTPAIPPTIFVPPVSSGGASTGGGAGTISPPNTGDAGLADGAAWRTYAGIAIMLVTAVAAGAIVRPRAL